MTPTENLLNFLNTDTFFPKLLREEEIKLTH